MKVDQRITDRLNTLLADELAAISQYIVHSEMCDNWGYPKLAAQIKKRAIEEMGHAEKLIERILFLDATPVVDSPAGVYIGEKIEQQFINDLRAETSAIKLYNDSIRMCTELEDAGTRELLEAILHDEEKHLDWLETQLTQIGQVEIENYLMEQAS
jgi:bacterioferritin